jgi:hypothetical protein
LSNVIFDLLISSYGTINYRPKFALKAHPLGGNEYKFQSTSPLRNLTWFADGYDMADDLLALIRYLW